MKVQDIIILCENQHRYRADNFLKSIATAFTELANDLSDCGFRQTANIMYEQQLNSIYLIMVQRRLRDGEGYNIRELADQEQYHFVIERYQHIMGHHDISDIRENGTFRVLRKFDTKMNDLGIEGESVVYFSGTDCHIDISYIREDVINLVRQIDRHNKLDNMIKENIEELERIVQFSIEPILDDIISNNNSSVLNHPILFVDVYNDHRTVTISLTLCCVFNAYKDWKNCRLPEKYGFRPTIRTGGEEFMGCIGDIISSGFSIKNKVVLDDNSQGIKINIQQK